ncbi:MAG: hypothetical protein LVQ95_00330 [Candidatus Micrarchaeales archaeon]|nr:hypothetical protein [Candidatus Micrarchaeales archaeon]
MEGTRTKEPESVGCEGKAEREPIQIRPDVECSVAPIELRGSEQENNDDGSVEC